MAKRQIFIHNQRNESALDWHKIIAGKDMEQQAMK